MEGRQTGCRIEGGKAILTIDREGARNALSSQVLRELSEGLDAAEADGSVRVVVVTGAGNQVFSAGGDLAGAEQSDPLQAHEARRAYGGLIEKLGRCSRPSIARINGHALGGGLGLALACDLAVAAEGAQLGTPEIDVGLFPMMVMALLHRHLGRKRALELVMTGERLSAPDGLALGLVNRVVPFAQLDEAVNALASKLAGKSQATLRLGRRAFFASEDMPFGAALEFLAGQLSINASLEDAAEGVAAFLGKRKPSWSDR
jgi:enoyl-CoA hydratase/carnithine racemase